MESTDLIQRQKSWNVFFLTEDDEIFSGLYLVPDHGDAQAPRRMTYQDVLDWLKKTFRFKLSRRMSKQESSKFIWALVPHANFLRNSADCDKAFLAGDQEALSKELPITKGPFYLVRHRTDCDKACHVDDSFKSDSNHIRAVCTVQVRKATPKLLLDYRPFVPPPTTYEPFQDGSWKATMGSPHGTHDMIPSGVTNAESTMNQFHKPENSPNKCCALSGEGSWLLTEDVDEEPFYIFDPWLIVSHIIPPEHYDVYPISGSTPDYDAEPQDDDYSLDDKWDMTWHTHFNSIPLLKEYHRFWKARLLAIDPETLVFHVFGPYETIIPYHGKEAVFEKGKTPDVEALRWHYRMCIYENMTARARMITEKGERDHFMENNSDCSAGSDSSSQASDSSDGRESCKRKRVQWWNREQSPPKKAKTDNVHETIESRCGG